jgi:hypothetical protein
MTMSRYQLPHRLVRCAALLVLLALAGCGDEIRFRPVFGSPGGYTPPVNTGYGFSGAGTRG